MEGGAVCTAPRPEPPVHAHDPTAAPAATATPARLASSVLSESSDNSTPRPRGSRSSGRPAFLGRPVQRQDSEAAEAADRQKEVRVRCDFTRVLDIDLQRQTFTAALRIEATWLDAELNSFVNELLDLDLHIKLEELHDDRLLGSRSQGYYNMSTESLLNASALRDKSAEERLALKPKLDELVARRQFWFPRLKLRNTLGTLDSDHWWMAFYPSDGGPVACYRWEVVGKFQEQMELHSFPFDIQDLNVELQSGFDLHHKKTPVTLVKQLNELYPSVCNSRFFVQSSEYRLYDGVRFEHFTTLPVESSTRKFYSCLRMTARVDRLSGYWVLNVMLPLFIVTTSLFASFQVPFDNIEGRVNMNLTLLLALVAFKYVISDQLPNVSYLTFIDWYLLGCFLVAFLVLFYQVLAAANIIAEPQLAFVINDEEETTDEKDGWVVIEESWAAPMAHALFGGRIEKRAGDRSTRVNMTLLQGLFFWVLAHVVGIVGVLVSLRRRRSALRDAHFYAAADAVWCSPVGGGDDVLGEDADWSERGKMVDSIEARLGAGTVKDVLLWSPGQATLRLERARGSESYLARARSGGYAAVQGEAGSGEEGRVAGKKSRSVARAAQEGQPFEGLDPYKSTRCCAVVRFYSVEDADQMVEMAHRSQVAMRRLRRRGGVGAGAGAQGAAWERHPLGDFFETSDGLFQDDVNVHKLNMAYYPLALQTMGEMGLWGWWRGVVRRRMKGAGRRVSRVWASGRLG